jgi:hypothetical protein
MPRTASVTALAVRHDATRTSALTATNDSAEHPRLHPARRLGRRKQ